MAHSFFTTKLSFVVSLSSFEAELKAMSKHCKNIFLLKVQVIQANRCKEDRYKTYLFASVCSCVSSRCHWPKIIEHLKFVIALVLLSCDNDNKLVKVLKKTDTHYVLNTWLKMWQKAKNYDQLVLDSLP